MGLQVNSDFGDALEASHQRLDSSTCSVEEEGNRTTDEQTPIAGCGHCLSSSANLELLRRFDPSASDLLKRAVQLLFAGLNL